MTPEGTMTAADLRTDDAHFLARIIADPDSDAERLIYADWLEEQGRAERAEFVRVQVALAGRKPCIWDPPCYKVNVAPHHQCHSCQSGAAFRQRERELLKAHASFWAASLFPGRRVSTDEPDGPDVSVHARQGGDVLRLRTIFRRGFVESVTLPAAAWLANGPALVRAVPLRRVSWSDCGVIRHGVPSPDGDESYGLAVPSGFRERLPHDLRKALSISWPTRQAGEDAVSAAALAWAKAQPA
jgi:uncharacterized protein (TIGR02996 family)